MGQNGDKEGELDFAKVLSNIADKFLEATGKCLQPPASGLQRRRRHAGRNGERIRDDLVFVVDFADETAREPPRTLPLQNICCIVVPVFEMGGQDHGRHSFV